MFQGLSVILCPDNSMTLHCHEHDGEDPQYCCQVPVPEFLVGISNGSLVAFSTVRCIISYTMKPVFILNILVYNLQFENWTNGMKSSLICSKLHVYYTWLLYVSCASHKSTCIFNQCVVEYMWFPPSLVFPRGLIR